MATRENCCYGMVVCTNDLAKAGWSKTNADPQRLGAVVGARAGGRPLAVDYRFPRDEAILTTATTVAAILE